MPVLYVDRRRRLARAARLSVRRAAQAGDVLMTAHGVRRRSSLYLVVLVALVEAARRATWRASTRASASWLEQRPRPARAPHLPRSPACRATTSEMTWKTLRARDAPLQRRRASSSSTRSSACRASCRSTRRDCAAVDARLVVQHRGQLRDEHELAELRRRDDDELPHADARAHRAELRLARRRAWRCSSRSSAASRASTTSDASATSGSISRAARSTSCCRSRSSSRSSSSRRASCRRSRAYRDGAAARRRRRTPTARRSPTRSSRSARPRRRSRSSSSAPTAAASSTSTRRTRSRTRRRSRTSSRCSRSSLIPAALCYTFGKMVGDTRQGWARPRRDVRHLPPAALALRRRRSRRRTPRSPSLADRPGRERAPGRRQHGGQGGPLRHRELRALGDGDDGRVERRRSTRCTTPSRRSAGSCRCG